MADPDSASGRSAPDEPRIARKEPYGVEVREGRTYLWCTCGRSARQPFCDASHKGSGFQPLAWRAEQSGEVWFCACKRTGDRPFCDGTHNSL